MSDYESGIDFDEASREWRKNKVHIGNGMFKYVCGALKADGKNNCKRNPGIEYDRCWQHRPRKK